MWEFTDLEFVTLWGQADGNMVPMPLSYSTDIQTWGEFAAAQARIVDRLRQMLRNGVADMMDVLINADIRVTALGRNAQDLDDPAGCVRVFGARKGTKGWVIRQQPGKNVWHSGGFVATECEAVRLADAVVACLPEAVAGHIPEVVLPAPQADVDENDGTATDYSYGQSSVFEAKPISAGRSLSRFLAAPATSVGVIEVSQERSLFGPRGRIRRHVRWRDLADDGRYVISADTPPVARGAHNARLIGLINTEIAAVVQSIKDESA